MQLHDHARNATSGEDTHTGHSTARPRKAMRKAARKRARASSRMMSDPAPKQERCAPIPGLFKSGLGRGGTPTIVLVRAARPRVAAPQQATSRTHHASRWNGPYLAKPRQFNTRTLKFDDDAHTKFTL